MNLKEHVEKIEQSYSLRKRVEGTLWEGFEKEKRELEKRVEDAFGEVLNEIQSEKRLELKY